MLNDPMYYSHQTEPSLEILDSESACILDGFPRMYVWIGRRCNYALRNKVQIHNSSKKIKNIYNQKKKKIKKTSTTAKKVTVLKMFNLLREIPTSF